MMRTLEEIDVYVRATTGFNDVLLSEDEVFGHPVLQDCLTYWITSSEPHMDRHGLYFFYAGKKCRIMWKDKDENHHCQCQAQ